MKHIRKAAEPQAFLDWKKGQDPDWCPSYAALDSDRTMKALVRDALFAEQGFLCSYCNCRIGQSNSHIEHIKPQRPADRFPGCDIDYANMVMSCEPEHSPYKDSCGHAKGNDYQPEQFVSPTDPDCEAYFTYTLDGQLRVKAGLPRSDAAAETRRLLRLDQATLRMHRKAAIEGLALDLIESQDAARAELQRLQQLQPEGFAPFCAALTYILRDQFCL